MVSSSIFKVFGMTRPGIEPRSPGPLANTLTAGPMSRYYQYYNGCWYSSCQLDNFKQRITTAVSKVDVNMLVYVLQEIRYCLNIRCFTRCVHIQQLEHAVTNSTRTVYHERQIYLPFAQSIYIYIYIYIYHPHHDVPLAGISLNFSRHLSLSSTAPGRSSILHP